jgi:hypothetical protein
MPPAAIQLRRETRTMNGRSGIASPKKGWLELPGRRNVGTAQPFRYEEKL